MIAAASSRAGVPIARWTLVGSLAAASGTSCARGEVEVSRCVSDLCLRLSERTEVATRGDRHTFRPPGASGWIDVQVVRPGARGPATLEEAARTLARRHELAGFATLHRTGTANLGGRAVGVEDATITWRGRAYRRVTYLAPARGGWLAIDETAPADRFAQAHAQLEPLLRGARWSL